MVKIEDIIEGGTSCMIPIYQATAGNATKIIAEDGNIYIDNRTIKTVLRTLCQCYTIQIELCRKKYGQMIHQSLCVPILINSKLLMIPLKMRKPMFEKDGAYGYINFNTIKEVVEKEGNTLIRLHNGQEVLCLQRLRTVQQHINKAKVIAGSNTYSSGSVGSEKLQEFYTQYDSPATRGDIASLQKEILELTRVLRGVVEKRGMGEKDGNG